MPLPDDMWIQVCSYLKMEELLIIAAVSKNMSEIANMDELWRPLAKLYVANDMKVRVKKINEIKNVKMLLKNSILMKKKIKLQSEKLKDLIHQKKLVVDLIDSQSKVMKTSSSLPIITPFFSLNFFFQISNAQEDRARRAKEKELVIYHDAIRKEQSEIDKMVRKLEYSNALENAICNDGSNSAQVRISV